jgi:hypothetical protein
MDRVDTCSEPRCILSVQGLVAGFHRPRRWRGARHRMWRRTGLTGFEGLRLPGDSGRSGRRVHNRSRTGRIGRCLRNRSGRRATVRELQLRPCRGLQCIDGCRGCSGSAEGDQTSTSSFGDACYFNRPPRSRIAGISPVRRPPLHLFYRSPISAGIGSGAPKHVMGCKCALPAGHSPWRPT